MRRARWLASWRHTQNKPALYHCINHLVDRRPVLGTEQKERFRMLMRMQEDFTGCRVLAYCLMDSHFHLLVEVPAPPAVGLSDEGLLERLRLLYSKEQVDEVAAALVEARHGKDAAAEVARIHARYTYRMNSLGEFMKGLLQRYTSWHNRTHDRKGRLWEDRFKSVIVEDGVAARTITAYIDLNPVRAGLVDDPAEYRWSSYGEASSSSSKTNAKTARAGLVRALRAHEGVVADASLWQGELSRDYRRLLMAGAEERGSRKTKVAKTEAPADANGKGKKRKAANAEAANEGDQEAAVSKALRQPIRYFSDGVALGSRDFVNEAFEEGRDRFGPRRKDGARKLRGAAAPLSKSVWNLRDLHKGVTDGKSTAPRAKD